ncbi:type II secretion system F family protein [Limosilactobacillus sp. BG-MG3-A]|uniref:Type II secretion system F family protein n=1 Tax=Limosilactobacillus agrestis TaxID=2759748 RepID=A0A7W3UGG0_9LACO|nr:type II secretion system F family protein [Limosilactobacillus agrestis]MBB1095156.1 type II secretion system F family protein [Limosilactobacillus agrestis]
MTGQKDFSRLWKMEKLRRILRGNIVKVKFTHQQQANFFLLLADLLSVGFSIREALGFIKTVKPKLSPWIDSVDKRMRMGASFAQSLQTEIKDDLFYQLLLAEKHGNLTKTLSEIGKILAARERQRKKLFSLLQYPLILLGMLGVVICGLLLFVFPELKVWQGEGETLPTIHMITLGTTYLFTIIFISTVFQWLRWYQMDKEQRLIKICTMPIVGKCYCFYFQYYLTSILGSMLQQGLSLAEICEITQSFDKESILYIFGNKIMKTIQRNGDISEMMATYSFLPNELIIFMNKGATRENVGRDLTVFANLKFQALTTSIERLLIFVQPVIFSIIAIIIVVLYLSILLPIYHSFQGVY